MAEFNGINKVKSEDSNVKIHASEYYGKLRVISEEYELSAALNVGDKIVGPELPFGAKILDASVKSTDMGATGIFDLGIRELDNGVASEVPAGLVSQADAGGQPVFKRADSDSSLIGEKIAEGLNKASYPLITVTETTTATSGKIQVYIILSVE